MRAFELTQKSTGITFRAGMKVRGWDHGTKHRGSNNNSTPVEGIIRHIDRYYEEDSQHTVSLTVTKDYTDHPKGTERSIWFDTMELLTPPLDLSRPLAHRSGKPVTVVPTGDLERPFLANVSGMSLTFDQYGHFYPDPRAAHRSGEYMNKNHEFHVLDKQGRVFDWDDNIPKVGAIVEDTGSLDLRRKGQRGTVLVVRQSRPGDAHIAMVKFAEYETPKGWFIWRVKPILEEIDPTNIASRTRGGHVVHTSDLRGDCIQAQVQVRPGLELTLRFNLDGRFVMGRDCPIDLVQNV